MTNSIADIADSRFILAVGTNATETHPVLSLSIRKALSRGAKLVAVDPRRTEMADLAHIHLQIRPGTDLALISAMTHVIISEGLMDQEYVDRHTEGFGDLEAAVRETTPLWAQEITGVSADLIAEAARGYAGGDPSAILYTMGLTQHTSGTDNVMSLANLALLTGNLGRPGGGVNPLRGQNNVQGACDMGALPGVLTGYQPVGDQKVRARFAAAWGVDDLPAEPGLMVGDMFDRALAGNVAAMYVVGENPVLSDADAGHVKDALSELSFLVVQDLFLTETAQLADVVLPAASFAEKDGTFVNTERRVQRVRRAVSPRGQSRPDSQIICQLAAAMGHTFDYRGPEAVMDEISDLTPQYGGISYRRLEEAPLQWPCPDPEHPGTPILYVDGFPRGRGQFSAPSYLNAGEEVSQEFPLTLTTGRRRHHYHTGSMTRRSGLTQLQSEEVLDMNPDDAHRAGIGDGDSVLVTSRRGAVTMKAHLTDSVGRGTLFTTFHFAESPVNMLTNPDRDTVAGIPALKVAAVRVEPAL